MQHPSAPYSIVGRDDSGRVVAEEETDALTTASKVATSWRDSGLTVDVQGPTDTQS